MSATLIQLSDLEYELNDGRLTNCPRCEDQMDWMDHSTDRAQCCGCGMIADLTAGTCFMDAETFLIENGDGLKPADPDDVFRADPPHPDDIEQYREINAIDRRIGRR